MAVQAMDDMSRKFNASGFDGGTAEESLPSFDDVKHLYEVMYDTFNSTDSSSGNSTARPTEEDAMNYLNSRIMSDPDSTTAKEGWVCIDMFRSVLNVSLDSPMNLTNDDITTVTDSCRDDRNRYALEANGYSVDNFCPLFGSLLPLRFQVLPESVKTNLTSLCSFVVDNIFVTAGEPMCYHRMEEVVLANAIARKSLSFWAVI